MDLKKKRKIKKIDAPKTANIINNKFTFVYRLDYSLLTTNSK